ncbi:MAG: helicase-related protein [Thermodesulfobacteriota bacterium]
MVATFQTNDWVWSSSHKAPCRIVEVHSLWSETICQVWFPGSDSVVRIPASRLKSLESASTGSPEDIAYVAAAARVADALTQDVLLAPIESSVIPLPHQIRALSRAIAGERVRYLLADEVGLGKTIEAGLVMRELKLRGLVRRTLVVVPKGLATQWVAEMETHFDERFQLVLPDDLKTIGRISGGVDSEIRVPGSVDIRIGPRNAWALFPQIVVPMDSVKPLDKRRGWTPAQVGDYNRERFEDLISAGWDLIIVDEAHRLGGSTDQVARFKLGQGLSEAAPYLLLLSATPHQGKTDAFHRLVSLIDSRAFPDISSVTRERIQPHVIRTEKRRAIGPEGNPLFKPRLTRLAPVSWGTRHRDQELLYEAVTEYVRVGYNQAMREKRSYIGFLMILMQRLVVSSTSAIRTSLEKRLQALGSPEEQLSLFPAYSEEDWADLDGQEQMETLLRTRLKGLKNERAEVKLLLEAATRCEAIGPDAKAEALLEWIYRLQAEEEDPEFKVLVFTEFVPTQEMLRQFLAERGFSVICLNGSMGMDERKEIQDAFAREARILVSTDAGGEGLNLQFCHVVINYDIPWNPMRLEQRIGRVDRIGQTHMVKAVNFVFENSVEHRVREVLEQKLAVIFEEFGVDKTGDVLDSAQAGRMYDELYMDAILNPEKIDDSVENLVTRIKEDLREARSAGSVLGATEDLDPSEAQRFQTHPLPHWVERMTVCYLKRLGRAERKGRIWKLTWPDGLEYPNVVFTPREAEENPTARYLTLEDPRVRGLTMRLPRFVPGQPIPVVSLDGIAPEIQGIWSLWRISITISESGFIGKEYRPAVLEEGPVTRRRRIMPLFVADSGEVYALTAKHIWDRLLAASSDIRITQENDSPQDTFSRIQKIAEDEGQPIYEMLVAEHRHAIVLEREKAQYAFAARRRAIERVGLPQVRDYRLNMLEQEESSLMSELNQRAYTSPELFPLIMVRITGGRP